MPIKYNILYFSPGLQWYRAIYIKNKNDFYIWKTVLL